MSTISVKFQEWALCPGSDHCCFNTAAGRHQMLLQVKLCAALSQVAFAEELLKRYVDGAAAALISDTSAAGDEQVGMTRTCLGHMSIIHVVMYWKGGGGGGGGGLQSQYLGHKRAAEKVT